MANHQGRGDRRGGGRRRHRDPSPCGRANAPSWLGPATARTLRRGAESGKGAARPERHPESGRVDRQRALGPAARQSTIVAETRSPASCLHEVAGTGNGHQRKVLFHPVPGAVQPARQQRLIVQPVEHQHRASHLREVRQGLRTPPAVPALRNPVGMRLAALRLQARPTPRAVCLDSWPCSSSASPQSPKRSNAVTY